MEDRPPAGDPHDVQIGVRGDCGHEFMVPVAGLELEGLEFACPVCGAVDRFSADQAKEIVERFEAAKPQAFEEARKLALDAITNALKT